MVLKYDGLLSVVACNVPISVPHRVTHITVNQTTVYLDSEVCVCLDVLTL